jgi:hypothetical protein
MRRKFRERGAGGRRAKLPPLECDEKPQTALAGHQPLSGELRGVEQQERVMRQDHLAGELGARHD